jgi:hypothetical protein
MERWIAGFLQLMAAILFFVMGAEGDDAFLLVIPAVVSGVSGLLLWNRARREEPVIPPSPAPRALEGSKVDRIEDALTALQADVAQLREDREFYRELYADPTQRPGSRG